MKNSDPNEANPGVPTFAILLLDELDISQNSYISSKTPCPRQASKRKNVEGNYIETCENISATIASSSRKRLLVKNVVIRNLCGSNNWELPLYLDFDRKVLRKQILMEIISEVEEKTGGAVQVWAIVLSTIKDVELIEELCLDEEMNSFPNPVDSSRSVHCFADTNTLLYQLEKQIISHGIEIQNNDSSCGRKENVRLTSTDFEDLIETGKKNNSFSSELQCLNSDIINYKKVNQNEISFKDLTNETRILSTKTADVLETLFPEKIVQAEWIRVCAYFIKLMTQQPSTTINSHTVSDQLREPFASDKNLILDKMLTLVSGIILGGEKNKTSRENNQQTNQLHLIQKALLWTIKSLKSLHSHVQSYLIAFANQEDGQDWRLMTCRFNFNDYDAKFHKTAQSFSSQTTNPCDNEAFYDVQNSAPRTTKFNTKRPKLYQNVFNCLTFKEDLGEGRIRGRRARAGKVKQNKRQPSPPPTNPSTILEYKLSVEEKVHIPLGHPQIESIKNRNRFEIVTKEPQIKIVYPDDPENMLLMLQQQHQQQPNFSASEQMSVLQDSVGVTKQGSPVKSILQANILQGDYSSSDGTTIVISENVDENFVKKGTIDTTSVKSTIDAIGIERNNMVRINQVDIVDAEGHINENYYMQ